MVELAAENMMDVWQQAIDHIQSHGVVFTDDDGKECIEVQNLGVTIEHPETAVIGVRKMRSIRTWYYPSEEELSAIMLNKEGTTAYEYLYGQRIFSYEGILNQVEDYIVPLLKERPHTRRATISLINPTKDFTSDATNVPGIFVIRFRVVNGKLTATAIIRTSGFFTGWPANMFQLMKLQQYVGEKVGIPLGRITTYSMSAHLHLEQFPEIEKMFGSILECK